MQIIPTIVILIGLPGSGKSTFYQKVFSRTHLRINLDMLKTRNREMKILEACLATNQSVVIDNTNVKVADRERYIQWGKDYGFRIIGYFINSSVDKCLQQNLRRPDDEQVPKVAILSKKRDLAYPRIEEGFDLLHFVTIVDDGSFLVEDWKSEV